MKTTSETSVRITANGETVTVSGTRQESDGKGEVITQHNAIGGIDVTVPRRGGKVTISVTRTSSR